MQSQWQLLAAFFTRRPLQAIRIFCSENEVCPTSVANRIAAAGGEIFRAPQNKPKRGRKIGAARKFSKVFLTLSFLTWPLLLAPFPVRDICSAKIGHGFSPLSGKRSLAPSVTAKGIAVASNRCGYSALKF